MVEKRVSKDAVMAVDAPEWTHSWHPVAHRDLLSALDKTVTSHGMEVVNENYSMNGSGTRLFGSWEVMSEGGTEDRIHSIGFRQAVDKSMSIGLCSGMTIVVCANMQFSGDFITFRKHTAGLEMESIRQLTDKAVENIIVQWKELDDWFQVINKKYLSHDHFKEITFDLQDSGAVLPSKFKEFNKAVDEELETHRFSKFGGYRSLGTVQGAVTRMVRNKSMFTVSETNTKLNMVLNKYLDRYPLAA